MGDGKIIATGGVKANEINISGVGSVYGAGSFNIADSLRLRGDLNFDISRAAYAEDYLPPELFLNLEHDWFQLGGGFFYEGPWNGSHLLGARAKVGKPWLNAEVYGGYEISETWAGGRSKQYLDDRPVFGVTLAGGIPEIQVRVGYKGDASDNNSLPYSLVASPWRSIRIFSSGNFAFDDGEHRSIVAGAHFEAADAIGISVMYENRDNPAFFNIDVLGRDKDNRGRVAVFVEPVGGLHVEASGMYGEKFAGVDASLGMKGTTVHGRYLYGIDSETNSIDLGANIKFKAGDHAIFGVHVEGSYDMDSKNWWTGLGGNAVFAPLSWLTIFVSGSYVFVPHADDGWNVNARASLGFGGATDRTVALPYSSRRAVKYDEPIMPRQFGALMNNAVPSFNHHIHMTEHGADSCTNCHSDSNILIKTTSCNPCHESENPVKKDPKILEALKQVSHPFQMTGNSCQSCHDGIEKLTAPTGGYGQIIIYPHKLETRNANGVWSHRGRVVDTCNGCHTDDSRVQFDGRTVVSCKSCHDGIQKIQSPHSDDFFVGHGTKARFGVETCASCHTDLGTCRSCHEEKLTTGTNFHLQSNWMNFGSDDRMIHGKIAQESGGMLCGACHSKASTDDTCGRCH